MVRPRRFRRVAYMPDMTYFKPAGIPLMNLEEVILSVEEIEAIRLKELENLDQEQAAVRMNISRPTFQRILGAARKKIADALLNGKAIRIQGGNFEMAPVRFGCINGHKWDVPFDTVKSDAPQKCPTCGSLRVEALMPLPGPCGRGRQNRFRGGHGRRSGL